jgi:hypothetical protein
MDIPSTIREWIIPGSVFITLISTTIGVCLSLKELRIKTKAETLIHNMAIVEMDIKLLNLFQEIMKTAHAREESHVSEKAIEFIGKQAEINKETPDFNSAIITYPVGRVCQNAAISAIYTLGSRHEVLKTMAEEALEGLITDNVKAEEAKKYLEKLRSFKN